MSVSITQLWLPIILGAVFCWIASALIHMLIKYHNADYKKLDNEDQVADVIRKGNSATGLYHMPHCKDMKDMNDEGMQKKFIQGPVAMITIFQKGLPPMGKLLGQQLLYFIFACVLIAYVASLGLASATEFMQVFRLVFVVSFLSFGFAVIPYSIWFGHPWSNCVRFLIDALIYAATVATTFAWLWPASL